MKRSGFKNPGKPLAPGKGFKPRAAPMGRGISTLATRKPLVANKPIERGGVQLQTRGALTRAKTPLRTRSKTNSDPRPKTGEAELCRGQPCYLRVPGILAHPGDTVVPCHSNQARHGKGKGIKAHDRFTVPGCHACHAELDQGKRFTREEKFALWDAAFARWEIVRAQIQQSVAT
jgi:hypothetical protein